MRIEFKNWQNSIARKTSGLTGISLLIAGGLVLSACSSGSKISDPFAGKGSPIYKKAGPIPKGGGRRHLGKPYAVGGRKFYPKREPNYDKVGIASWYGGRFHKRQTANGEWYNMNDITAAHKTLPIPSYARVTNLSTGKQLIVRINDRGPFVNTRIIDLSRKSADILGTRRSGLKKVRVEYLGPAPLQTNGSDLAQMNRQLNNGASKAQLIALANGRTPSASRIASAANTSTYTSALRGYFVQVGAYGVKENARRAKLNASSLGRAVISPANGTYGTIYRVRIGPLSNERQAIQVQQRAVNNGHYDAKVVTQ